MPNFPSMTDTELLQSVSDVRLGQLAMRELYERYAGRLLAFVRSRFPQIAFNVTQETWLRAWREFQEGRVEGKNVRAWLFRVAANLGIDFHRKRTPEQLPEDIPDQRPGGVNEAAEERRKKLTHCLELLARKNPEHSAAVVAWQNGTDAE